MAPISVIIPCYNVESVIDRCMESLICQTISLDCLEIILVNDCSTDGTLEKLRLWESKFPERIILIDCEKNGHLGTARNIGLSYSMGEWVSFIDSDDWIEPDYFEKMLEAGERNSCQLVSCGYERDNANYLRFFEKDSDNSCGKEILYGMADYQMIDGISERKRFFNEQPLRLYAWGKLIRRDFLNENKIYFPDHMAYEDIFWGNLVHMYINRACILPNKLYHYYVNDNSLVLKLNAPHHVDHITAQELMWQEWINRGFFEQYKEELEFEYLYNGYLSSLKILILRYDEPQYSLFRLICELAKEKISNPLENKYVVLASEFHKMLISAIYMDLSKDEFFEFAEKIKMIGL